MLKVTEAIKSKTPLKYKDLVKAKLKWGNYRKESKGRGITKEEVMDKIEELREK